MTSKRCSRVHLVNLLRLNKLLINRQNKLLLYNGHRSTSGHILFRLLHNIYVPQNILIRLDPSAKVVPIKYKSKPLFTHCIHGIKTKCA